MLNKVTITDNTPGERRFSSLETGQMFQPYNTEEVFIKGYRPGTTEDHFLNKYAVSLSDGFIRLFASEERVTPLPAETAVTLRRPKG